MNHKKIKLFSLITLSAFASLALVTFAPSRAAAACSPSGNYGSVTESVSIPSAATYRVWSRLNTGDAQYNSYMLEVDGGTCYSVGGASLTANTWTWVDYQGGNSASKINVALTSGTHTFKLFGNAPNVEIDRLILTADTTCVPTSTGDNCVSITPTPTATPTAAPSPTATPSPSPGTGIVGDINHDGHVTAADLAVQLSNWQRTVTTGTGGDLNNDGKVTSVDLALLLSNWGK